MLADWSGNVKREKQILRYEMKEQKTIATPHLSSWTILMTAFWTRERRFFIQSQLSLRHVVRLSSSLAGVYYSLSLEKESNIIESFQKSIVLIFFCTRTRNIFFLRQW